MNKNKDTNKDTNKIDEVKVSLNQYKKGYAKKIKIIDLTTDKGCKDKETSK